MENRKPKRKVLTDISNRFKAAFEKDGMSQEDIRKFVEYIKADIRNDKDD